jgi:hypothetical protein
MDSSQKVGQTSALENRIIVRLKKILPKYDSDLRAQAPWRPFKGSGGSIYQPAVDVAIGPFAVGALDYERKYDELPKKIEPILSTWIRQFKRNWKRILGKRRPMDPNIGLSNINDLTDVSSNRNARCFIAFEFENEDSRKHIMGSIVNAGALGRIGVIVAEQDSVLKATIRLGAYIDHLQKFRNKTFNMGAILIISDKQLLRSLKAKAAN